MDAFKDTTGAVKAKLADHTHKPHTGPKAGLQDHVHEMKHVVHGEEGRNPVQNGRRSDGPAAQKMEHAVQGAKDALAGHGGGGSGGAGLKEKVDVIKASAKDKMHQAGA